MKKLLIPIDTPAQDSGIKSISCIYVINLKQREDRWEYMKSQLESYELYGNRVEAVNGWALSYVVQKSMLDPRPLYKLNGGQIGCALSHISVWQHALKMGFQVIWVLEDDVKLLKNPHALTHLVEELTIIDPDWDILYTDTDLDYRGCSGNLLRFITEYSHPKIQIKYPQYYLQREAVNSIFTKIHARFGTYSMLISKSGVEKLFRRMISSKLFSPIDHQIHTTIPSLRQYVMEDPVTIHAGKYSDTRAG